MSEQDVSVTESNIRQLLEYLAPPPENFAIEGRAPLVYWDCVAWTDVDALPESAGIYQFVADDVVLYVGYSTNLSKRFANGHRKTVELAQRADTSTIALEWIELPTFTKRQLLDLERYYILNLAPEMNNI